jgi:hypothetical protein
MAMTTVYPDGAKGAAIQEANIELNGRALRGFDGKLAIAVARQVGYHPKRPVFLR